MKKRMCMVILIALVAVLLFAACGMGYVCDICGKTFSGTAYVGGLFTEEKLTLCKDCAKEYWYPFDYRQYKK